MPHLLQARSRSRTLAFAAALALACGGPSVDGLVFNEVEATIDFVELANAGTRTIDLSGLRLTDDTDDGMPRSKVALEFPQGTQLNPGELLLVVANREPALPGLRTECVGEEGPESCFHASWGISRSRGEKLYLLAPDGSVLLSRYYPPRAVLEGHSWGRLPDGMGGFGANAPTPGRSNRRPWEGDADQAVRESARDALFGEAPEKSSEALARELLLLSGLPTQFPSLQRVIAEDLERRGADLPDGIRAALIAGASSAYSPDSLEAAALARLRRDLDRARAAAAIAWLRKPLAREIAALERAFAEESDRVALDTFSEALAVTPADPQRVEWLRRLDRASGSTELSVEFSIARGLAVEAALAAVREESADVDTRGERLDERRRTLRPLVEEEALRVSLYTYRELAAEKLAGYVAFLESPTGAWYAEHVGAAVRGALGASAVNVRASLGRRLGDLAAQQGEDAAEARARRGEDPEADGARAEPGEEAPAAPAEDPDIPADPSPSDDAA